FFIKGDIPDKLLNYFNEILGNIIKSQSEIINSNILIQEINDDVVLKTNINQVNIGISSNRDFFDKFENIGKDFDIIIYKEPTTNVGIILFYNEKHFPSTCLLRRHFGFIPSSRKIKNPKKNKNSQEKETELKKIVAKLEYTQSENCFLYPSGMAAVFSAINSLIYPEKTKFIAIGSLYVDTIRILEKLPIMYGMSKTLFITNNYLDELEKKIDSNTAGIIFEFPSNPLIKLIEVNKLVSLAQSNNVKIVCDNTIATPYNFNPLKFGIDIIVHSTTKFLNGKNNHIGGLLITNNKDISKRISDLSNIADLGMDDAEINVLLKNIKNFSKRMEKINSNSFKIAQFLRNHKAIDKVYYPMLKTSPDYRLAKEYLKGGSGLISFTLKTSTSENAALFYDNLKQPILKGPSLGSEKTLLSPYVVMAHYNDDKNHLKKQGLDFYLMRISVGIEKTEKIIKSLKYALEFVK
ncbi:MAG: PLP-dependent transferase, partial [Promethearchaeota archaeon]